MTTTPDQLRQKVVDLIKDKTELDNIICKDLEIGIYNWCIKYAEDNRIIKSWGNTKFHKLYMEKARSIISNINKNSYIENNRLIDRLKEKEFLPHEIPFMNPENLFPLRWADTVSSYMKKYEHAYENTATAMTDQFLCKKCKKRETTYYEIFSRSADEPAIIHIRCINCGNTWKIG